MKCAQCGKDNLNDAKFCSSCGAKLESICPKCGAVAQLGDLFCRVCGTDMKSVSSPKKTKASKTKAGAPTPPETPDVSEPSTFEQPAPKSRKKMPVWLWVVLGLLVLACVLVAIFGEINFNFSAGKPTETALNTTITPILVATATTQATLTPTTTPTPVYETGNIEIFCEEGDIQFIYEHQPVSVGSFIYANEADQEQYFRDFMDKSMFNVNFDGEEIAPLLAFYTPFFDEQEGFYRLNFGFDADPLPVGTHLSEAKLSFKDVLQIPQSQGGMSVGPGTGIESFTFQCPIIVGAPDASWQVVHSTDFSTNEQLFESRKSEDEYLNYSLQEGENGVYSALLDVLYDDDTSYATASTLMPVPQGNADFLVSFNIEVKEYVKGARLGLVLRYNSDLDMGYKLYINPATQEVEFFEISQHDYSPQSPTLFTGQTTALTPNGKNNIVFFVKGNTFVLWINQVLVIFLQDDLVAEAGNNFIHFDALGLGQAVFELDDLMVRAPLN